MSKWIELIEVNLANELSPKLGTFGIVRLDLRYRDETHREVARKLMQREKNDVGFRILSGNSLLQAKPIYVYITDKYKDLKYSEYMNE